VWQEVMLDADIATLWDQFAYNAGFVVVRPTWYGRRVYELVRQRTNASSKLDDLTMNDASESQRIHYCRLTNRQSRQLADVYVVVEILVSAVLGCRSWTTRQR